MSKLFVHVKWCSGVMVVVASRVLSMAKLHGVFLDWHPLPTVSVDPEICWPWLGSGRWSPNLHCVRTIGCLWLDFVILRVFSNLKDSKILCAVQRLTHAALPAQQCRAVICQEPKELLSPVQLYMLGFIGLTFRSGQCVICWETSMHFYSTYCPVVQRNTWCPFV